MTGLNIWTDLDLIYSFKLYTRLRSNWLYFKRFLTYGVCQYECYARIKIKYSVILLHFLKTVNGFMKIIIEFFLVRGPKIKLVVFFVIEQSVYKIMSRMRCARVTFTLTDVTWKKKEWRRNNWCRPLYKMQYNYSIEIFFFSFFSWKWTKLTYFSQASYHSSGWPRWVTKGMGSAVNNAIIHTAPIIYFACLQWKQTRKKNKYVMIIMALWGAQN